MPWSETDTMKERTRFVLEWEKRRDEGEGRVNVAQLCREFGIARETGYKWLGRYQAAGFDLCALEEQSRRPHASPTAVPQVVEDLIVAERKLKAKWGPIKLRAFLIDKHPGISFPSASAFAAIFKRRGLVRPRARRRMAPVTGVTAPFGECDAANAVWCVDFKGWFKLGDGTKCHPLTLTDAFSRYVLRCEALAEADGRGVWRIFDSAFEEFGLPTALRSDNGPPFAMRSAPAGLTALAVWWLRLGIRLERIIPGHPEQNGRHERMHRTLALETEIRDNLRAEQRELDQWRREFNEERPHAALANRPPARIYAPSPRKYPRKLITPEPYLWNHTALVDKYGFIKLQRQRYFVSSAVRHLMVELERESEVTWLVKWGRILLGRLDLRRPGRIIPARPKRGEVSVISLE